MKKWMLVMLACFVAITFSAAQTADAAPKRGGSYNSGNKGYAPTKPADNVSKTDPAKSTTNPATPATGAKTGGFFGGGGGFMKGMMLGGLAGMLFGGLFGGMGFFGNILGLLVNVLAIFFLFVMIRTVWAYFRDRNKMKKRYQE